MEKIDRNVDYHDDRIRITSTSIILLWRFADKIDEIVDEINEHHEWHRRFFEKYNKGGPGGITQNENGDI